MKPGDLIQMSYEAAMCDSQEDISGSGFVVRRIIDSTLPADWPRIVVLWADGALEQMHEVDLVVISEGG